MLSAPTTVWVPRLTWGTNCRTWYGNRVYELWSHPYLIRSIGRYAQQYAWHLHPVFPNGETSRVWIYGPLTGDVESSQQQAELLLLGWRPTEPVLGLSQWRSPDGVIRLYHDVVSGRVPH